MLSLLVLLEALVAPVHAGFFTKDRYDPPTPRFGTLSFGAGVMAGYGVSEALLAEPPGRWTWQMHVHSELLILPVLAADVRGGRVGGGAVPGDDPTVGYRTGTWFLDFGPRLTTPRFDLYAHWAPASRTKVKQRVDVDVAGGDSLIEYKGDRFVATGGGHIAVGVDLLPVLIREVDPQSSQTGSTSWGVQLELRRSWWEDPEPDRHAWAPSSDAQTLVLVSVVSEQREGQRRLR
jgi:hypothetical protein